MVITATVEIQAGQQTKVPVGLFIVNVVKLCTSVKASITPQLCITGYCSLS